MLLELRIIFPLQIFLKDVLLKDMGKKSGKDALSYYSEYVETSKRQTIPQHNSEFIIEAKKKRYCTRGKNPFKNFGAVRNKDKKLVCTHLTTQKKWKAPLFEAWLRSVTLLRKRTGGCNIKELGCTLRKMHYIQRMENLKRISIPKFHRWRMTHHASTLTDHVCSTETQERQQMKKCWLILPYGNHQLLYSFLI